MGISYVRHLGEDGSLEPNSLSISLAYADLYPAKRGLGSRESRGKTKCDDDLSLALSFPLNRLGRGGSL